MNDILPPKRPLNPPPQSVAVPDVTPVTPPTVQPPPEPPKRRWKKIIIITLLILIVLIGLGIVGIWAWYTQQLRPAVPGSDTQVKVAIPSGTGPDAIGSLLKKKKVIRSSVAFDWYVRSHDVAGSLQSGVYRLSQGATLPSIVNHITSGKTDTFTITFFQVIRWLNTGRCLSRLVTISRRLMQRYKSNTIIHCFYKPKSADLEGYIYGETYEFAADASVEEILKRTFDEYYSVITANNLNRQV